MKLINKTSIFCFFIVCCFWAILLFYESVVYARPLQKIFDNFSLLFYIPHPNVFVLGVVENIHLYIFFYSLIFITGLISMNFYYKKSRGKSLNILPPVFLTNAFGIFSLIVVFQLYGQILFQKEMTTWLNNKTAHSKYLTVFGQPYYYAMICRKLLPGEHSGRLITDLDLKQDFGSFIHRQLAYFLYPIDIRNVQGEVPGVLIVFDKQDAINFVPEDYQIIKVFGPRHILAVKLE